MRLALLSDAHANLEALQAVVKDLEAQSIEKVFFLGDAVGYGADPNKCIKLIDNLCEIKLLGNHDFVALGLESPQYFNLMAQQSILWTRKELSKKSVQLLADFEMEATFLDYFLVHATPENPSEWNYILTIDDANRNFEYFSQTICFIGHSHQAGIYRRDADGTVTFLQEETYTAEENCRYIINVGSVGQPRDGNRDSCYAIVETDNHSIEFRRVQYDVEKAQEKMKNAALPDFLISRLAKGK